jgi:hypothetical protein
MPLKRWIQYLPDGFMLYIGKQTDKGLITSFSVALIFEDECIARYDTAHGFAHRDVLGRKPALIEKKICENVTNRLAFQHAISDLQPNFREYYAFYLAH